MIDADLSYQPFEVSPPGDTLRDLMDERALTQAELARRLGRPVQAVNEIMAGKKEITEDTALELERVLQVPAHFWLAREARYREYLARLRDAQGRKAQLPWLERFPLKALQEAGVLPTGRLTSGFKEQLIDDLLRFFSVASPEGWAAHYDKMQAQFRRAKPDQQTDAAAITAWLRMGELAAARLQTQAYQASLLEANLPAMRALSLCSAADISVGLTRLCAQAGVALVFVPALPGTHVSGVARWVGGKPLIQLSLLGKWNDGFWFSFFHEVGHIQAPHTRRVSGRRLFRRCGAVHRRARSQPLCHRCTHPAWAASGAVKPAAQSGQRDGFCTIAGRAPRHCGGTVTASPVDQLQPSFEPAQSPLHHSNQPCPPLIGSTVMRHFAVSMACLPAS